MRIFLLALVLLAQRPMSEIISDLDRLVTELKTRPETIALPCGGNVQSAVNMAKGGDAIVLAAGCRYVGAVTLTAKSGVVTIRSSAPVPERRITEADAPLLPILASGNMGPAILGTGATHWRLDGIQIEATANGAGEVVQLQDADDVTFDRILIVAGVNGQKRGIRGNGTHITLTRSHIANIWKDGQDSQAFCAWDGAGPYTLTDNYLEAASENVMFGGADSKSVERLPADILIEGNHFSKRLEWKGQSGKAVKNLFELKVGKRVIVRNNLFEHNWTQGQNGYGILVKSVNQNNTAPWSVTEDVLFEFNTLRNSENGVNILGQSNDPNEGRITGRTSRITFQHNDLQTAGVAFQVGGGVGDLTIDRNTIDNGWTFLQLYTLTGAVANLTVTGNVGRHNAYGVKGESTAIGTQSLVKFAAVWTWANNVLLGGQGKGTYPATTYYDLATVPVGVLVGK